MIQLFGKLSNTWQGEPFVAKIATDVNRPGIIREKEALILQDGLKSIPPDFKVYFGFDGDERIISLTEQDFPAGILPQSLNYLEDGDIVRISPTTGDISVLYRRNSGHNDIFLTEKCNCRCVMCPQPPRDIDDDFLIDVWMESVPLMSPDTSLLGITGGEPTTKWEGMLRIIRACRNYLPRTSLHLLSNGRMFNYMNLCQDMAEINHPDLLVGICLNSNVGWKHDYIVQSPGAFDHTIRGILNLKRCGIRIELRIVLMAPVLPNLVGMAKYVARNFPFVEHVALMGLEPLGWAKTNLGELWVNPRELSGDLVEAVQILSSSRIHTSIYNLPLCVLEKELWPYAQQSISDWKREYIPECQECVVKKKCGGVFFSAMDRMKGSVGAVH